jgi:hypothetical protein
MARRNRDLGWPWAVNALRSGAGVRRILRCQAAQDAGDLLVRGESEHLAREHFGAVEDVDKRPRAVAVRRGLLP